MHSRRTFHIFSFVSPTHYFQLKLYLYVYLWTVHDKGESSQTKMQKKKEKKQKENWNMSNEQAHAISVCGGVVGHELEHTVYS